MSSAKQIKAVVGSQYGDEGKGKLIDILATKADVTCRFNGGSNAGHTIVKKGVKLAVHTLPSGIFNRHNKCVLGNGVVINPHRFMMEVDSHRARGYSITPDNLFISDRAHLVLELHTYVDQMNEESRGKDDLGTTKQGIGPCLAEKANRTSIRVGELMNTDPLDAKQVKCLKERVTKLYEKYASQFFQHPAWENLEEKIEFEMQQLLKFVKDYKSFVQDTFMLVNLWEREGKSILLEGANAGMLDIDFGTYPFVTSSSTSVAGIVSGLGLASQKVTDIIGVMKAYTTRVGAGPFPTELNDHIGDNLRKIGGEYGTTTNRPRRCGWLDLVIVRYTHLINNYSSLNLTKLDVLTGFPTVKICVKYIIDGKEVDTFLPQDPAKLDKAEVVYHEMEGWTEDISGARKFEDLPINCQRFVQFIRNQTGIPISWIGVGADSEAMIEWESQ